MHGVLENMQKKIVGEQTNQTGLGRQQYADRGIEPTMVAVGCGWAANMEGCDDASHKKS